jgi:hypothetical protein
MIIGIVEVQNFLEHDGVIVYVLRLLRKKKEIIFLPQP